MSLKNQLAKGMGNILKLKGLCYMNIVEELGIADMSLKQIGYLKEINKTYGMTTSQLAESLDISKPTVTEMVKKFIKSDLVYKQSCPADGRVYYLKLTEKGQRIVDVDQLTNDFLAGRLMDILDEEDIKKMITVLNKIE